MNTSIIRKTIAAAGTVAAIAVVAPASWARVADYPAMAGTTASKDYNGFGEFGIGGVINNSGVTKEWLIPIDLRRVGCPSQGCQVAATYRGSPSQVGGCATSYFLNDFGAVINSFGPLCNGSALAKKNIGFFVTSADNLLVKFSLPPGGAVTSVEVSNAGFSDFGIGAIQGNTASFDWSNWGEYGAGGVRNKATTRREWLISVPSPDLDHAGATYVGGAGGSTCVIAFGVNADGSFGSGSIEICHNSAQSGFEQFIQPAHPNTLYVVKLAGASSANALDGGGIATVRY